MAFTNVFGGETIFPSQLSYLSITTAIDVTLQWPTEQQITGDNVVADFIDVDATVGSLNIDMPSALVTGTGNKATFNNVGANTFTVRDSTGGTIQSIAPGEVWIIVLRDNTTAAGLWRTFQMGASVSVASASALAGAGIKAIGALLNQKIDSDVEAATPFTVVDGDRAKCLVYTAGAGTANLTAAGTLGNDWFFMLRNSGSGTLNVLPPAGLIDGAASINLDPNDSAFIFTDGTDFFTVGLSSGSTLAFDFVSIPVPGSGDFVLSGANLDRIAYRFTGALTGNRRIVVPNTTQQYWVDNQTTNAFTLEIDTAAGAGILVPQGQSLIVYCDSIDVINATSSTSVAFPITIGQGGTNATTVGAAQINLQVPPDSRLLTAGDGIIGGGDLTADRTFDFDLASIGAVAPAVGDFLVLQDIDGGDINIKATVTDVLALLAGVTVEDEGVPLATLGTTLDFVGAAVVASGAGATKTITINAPANPMVSDLDGDGFNLDDMGVIFMREQASADAPVAGQGQLSVQDLTPNVLRYTDDVGDDFTLSFVGVRVQNADAAQSFNGGGIYAPISWGVTPAFETHDFYDSGVDDTRFTIPANMGGTYIIYGGVVANSTGNADGTYLGIGLSVNGGRVAESADAVDMSTVAFPNTGYAFAICSGPIVLAAAAFIELETVTDDTGSIGISTASRTYLALMKVG